MNTNFKTIRDRLIDSINKDVDDNQLISAETIADQILVDIPEINDSI